MLRHSVKPRHTYSYAFLSAVLGSTIGVLLAFVLAQCLLEISISQTFSLAVALTLLVFDIKLVTQTCEVYRSRSVSSLVLCVHIFFDLLCILSASICLVMDHSIILTPVVKAPLYGILGVTLCYVLGTIIVDLINETAKIFQRSERSLNNRGPIESTSQLAVNLAVFTCSGFYFGMVFGFMDVEDDKSTDHFSYHRVSIPHPPIASAHFTSLT